MIAPTTVTAMGPAARRYDQSRHKSHHSRLTPGYPVPKLTPEWPVENVTLLEKYREWLHGSGTSHFVIDQLYIPMAGHALGLNIKPYRELDIEADLAKALDYVKAKHLSAEWTDMCRCALEKFRLFLRQERGQANLVSALPDHSHYSSGLPDWLSEQLERCQHLRQRNWRPARLKEQTLNFWNNYTRVWRWLCERYPLSSLADVKRQYIHDYVDHMLSAGYAATTVNGDLRCFHAFLLYLQSQDYEVPQALLRLPSLKKPECLPRFLTDEQVRKLRDEMEEHIAQAHYAFQRRDALLDRACFYLLWQGGMRIGEVEELRLEDLDLCGRKLKVRQGKGLKDRIVYLTDTAMQALCEYLSVRGQGPSSHVFLYRQMPVHKDLIRARITAAGERIGVKVAPHRLRHTCATQLLNAGCRVTSIQKFLGHRQLNSTMIYARVHDRTVANDYYAAMAQIEKDLNLSTIPESQDRHLDNTQRRRLLQLADRLADPDINQQDRLDLVSQMRLLLACETPVPAYGLP